MKNKLLLLSLALVPVIFLSCGKYRSANNLDSSTSIVGKWELSMVQAGMTPVVNYSAGNGNSLVFTDANYQAFKDGQIVKSGTYKVVSDTTVQANVCLVVEKGEFQKRIVYDNDENATKTFLQVSNDKLIFLSGCFAYDAGSRTEYVKAENNK